MSQKRQEYWGSTDMVFQCLIDSKRTLKFKEAIFNNVKKDDIVADLGTGTGIMSMFAVKAGAKSVYAIEADREIYNIAKKNFASEKKFKKISLINSDATTVKLPKKVDVVICEMIATGLIDELQVLAMNNILKFCKKDVKVIPSSMQNYVDLIFINDIFYGQKLQTIQYEYSWNKKIKPIAFSKKHLYSDINFSIKNKLALKRSILIKATKNGIMNAIRISNKSLFPDGTSFQHSAAYCMPLILPIQKTKVKKGQTFLVKLEYQMCMGLKNLSYSVQKSN